VKPVESPYLVPFDGSFRVDKAATAPPDGEDDKGKWKKKLKKKLKKRVKQLYQLQRLLYADDRYAVLLIFQAMDAAGKDGTIRNVLSGVDPAGFQVYSFKEPSAEELDHDFLWRSACRLPERGRIGVFNRSYYEEALVVRAHPEYLVSQRLPRELSLDELWDERYASFRHHERHLWRCGTIVLKFWLNVSQDEQRRRFIDRVDHPEKHWKFSAGDIEESRLWDKYMQAYEDALNATSRRWAPWYAIPADDKDYMRLCVSEVVVKTIESMPLHYPPPDREDRERMMALREELAAELGD
jgi:PPK2 family polyphosphate:nucleotide phosphotransferase